MAGYIINLLKYATLPNGETLHGDEEQKSENNRTLLVFGDYDRLNVARIEDFSRYRDVNEAAKDWNGPRLPLLLYQIEDESCNQQPNLLDVLANATSDSSTDKECDRYLAGRFCVLTMVTLAPEFKKFAPYNTVLIEARKLILDQAKHAINNCKDQLKIQQDVEIEVYGSFLSAELAIVWTACEYVDILRIANTLRDLVVVIPGNQEKLEFNPFISLCSVISDADSGFREFNPDAERKGIKGKAALCIRYRDTKGDSQNQLHSSVIDNFLKNEGIIDKFTEGWERIGEYDYIMTAKADELCKPGKNPFHKDGSLHWRNDIYKKSILSTKLVLMDDEPPKCLRDKCVIENRILNDLEPINNPNISDNSTEEIIDKIRQIIYGTNDGKFDISTDCDDYIGKYNTIGLRSIIKKVFPETVGLCDSLDLLYTDFVNNCTNLNYAAWKKQLSSQFIGVIELIADEVRLYITGSFNADDMYANIAEAIHAYNQVVYHVAQSRRTIFTIPSSHLRYMGHYDVILHSYYGVINYYLNFAYHLPSTDMQEELIPFLAIDVVPDIKVRCQSISAAVTEQKYPKVLFTLNMPLSAVTDILRYAMILAHETFHMIVPFDRDRRNQIIGLLYFADFAANTVLLPLDNWLKYSENHHKIIQFVNEIIVLKKELQTALASQLCSYLKDQFYQDIHLKIGYPNQHHDPQYFNRSDYLYKLQDMLAKAAAGDEGEQSQYIRSLVNQYAHSHSKELNAVIEDKIDETRESIQYKIGDRIENHESDTTSVFEDIKYNVIIPNDPSARDYSVYNNYNLLDDIFDCSFKLMEGFQEAAQDLSMIRMFELDIVGYLVFRIRNKNDLLDLDNNYYTDSDSCRLGMLCDYLISFNDLAQKNEPKSVNDTLSVFEDCENELFAIIEHLPEMSNSSGVLKDSFIEDVNQAIVNVRKQIERYFTVYYPFRLLILQELSVLDIKPKFERIFRESPALKNTKEQLVSFYREWEDSLFNHDNYYSNIFRININLIHLFQYWSEFDNDLDLRDRNRIAEG